MVLKACLQTVQHAGMTRIVCRTLCHLVADGHASFKLKADWHRQLCRHRAGSLKALCAFLAAALAKADSRRTHTERGSGVMPCPLVFLSDVCVRCCSILYVLQHQPETRRMEMSLLFQ